MITVGVDLGQSADPTAILAVETDRGAKPVLRHIERVPLGTSYPKVVETLVEMTPVAGPRATRSCRLNRRRPAGGGPAPSTAEGWSSCRHHLSRHGSNSGQPA